MAVNHWVVGSIPTWGVAKKKMCMLFFSTFFTQLFLSVAKCDAPQAWQFGFQNPASPIAQGIQDLHNDICFFMIVDFSFCCVDAFENSLAFSLDKESSAK